MLTLLDGGDLGPTVASLRAACDALRAGDGRVTAVSLSGRVPDGTRSMMPLLSAAERLAAEYHCAVTMRLDGRTFVVRFNDTATGGAPRPSGAE